MRSSDSGMRARINANSFCLLLFFILVILMLIGYTIWCAVLTPTIHRSWNNKHKIEDLEDDIAELNNTLSPAVISIMKLTSSSLTLNNTVDFPFDNVVYDPFSLYDTTNNKWVADRDGIFQLSCCVTFDQSSTVGLPTSLVFDEQLQVYENDAISSQNAFLFVKTAKGDGVTTYQDILCGEADFVLSENDTLALRIQVRIYPLTFLDASIDGGLFAATRGSFHFLGT